MKRSISLFSGIGGLDLGLREYATPIAYCEIDEICQSVLRHRMKTGDIPTAPIYSDIRELHITEPYDIIVAGFPCQDVSEANRVRMTNGGINGTKSGLFWEIIRIVDETNPAMLFLENVPGLLSFGGTEVVTEIAARGYNIRWDIFSAAEVGAAHIRSRFFLLAYADGEESRIKRTRGKQEKRAAFTVWPSLKGTTPEPPERTAPRRVRRRNDGIPTRLDRLRMLGNAVHPRQARLAFEKLTESLGVMP